MQTPSPEIDNTISSPLVETEHNEPNTVVEPTEAPSAPETAPEPVQEPVQPEEPTPVQEPEQTVEPSVEPTTQEKETNTVSITTAVEVDTTCCSPWLSCAQFTAGKQTTNKTKDTIIQNNIDDTTHGHEFEWQTEFFKKFEWLKESLDAEEANALDEEGLAKTQDTVVSPKSKKQLLYQKACAILEEFLEAQTAKNVSQTPPVDLDHPEFSKLYLYFVALENNRMILHASFKHSHEQIIQDCVTLYEFARVYPPTKIVYVLEGVDFYDVDKYVKMFMNLFGIEETRGGAYTDVVLPDYMIQTLERELKIATVDHFVEQERRLSKDVSEPKTEPTTDAEPKTEAESKTDAEPKTE